MRNLGAPAGLSSTALAINDRGEVVGFAQSRAINHRALLRKDCRIYDLNAFLPAGSDWSLDEARGINHRGQIVGTGTWKGVWANFMRAKEGQLNCKRELGRAAANLWGARERSHPDGQPRPRRSRPEAG